MLSNFHTHTFRCNHANGTEREYIEAFISQGVKVLGFSDHTPQFFSDGYYSTYRMRPEQTEDYFDTLNKLKKEYKDDIEILIGFETEYFPETFDKLLSFYKTVNPDYVILGQHALYNERERFMTAFQTFDEKLMKDYSEQVIEGMKKGIFSYLAHPDVMNFLGNDELKEKCFTEIFTQAKKLCMPLEVNFYGMFDKRFYPSEMLYRIAKKVGNEMIFGVDAHAVDIIKSINNLEAEAKAKVNEYGLSLAKEMKLFNGEKIKIL